MAKLRATYSQMINLAFISLAFILLPVVAHAGGLGIAPVAAVAGSVSIALVMRWAPSEMPSWIWALLAFLAWAVFSSLWSPYESGNVLSNSIKLMIGVPLFLAFDQGLMIASQKSADWLRRVLLGAVFVGVAALFIDIVFPYTVTYLLDPLNAGENSDLKNGDIGMNLGHALVVYILIFPMVFGMLQSSRNTKMIAALLIAVVLGLAVKHGLYAVVLAAIGAICGMGLARWKPKATLAGLTGIGILSIILAPLMGFVAPLMASGAKARLPFSWEHRVEMWDYTLAKIMQAPILGHGFDAVRTYGDTFMIRGYEMPYISLHPHCAGLHIWVETGAIGALLAAITLFLIGRRAIRAVIGRPELAVPMAGYAAGAIIICTVTFGVWQDWWWAALIVTASARHLIPTAVPPIIPQK